MNTAVPAITEDTIQNYGQANAIELWTAIIASAGSKHFFC